MSEQNTGNTIEVAMVESYVTYENHGTLKLNPDADDPFVAKVSAPEGEDFVASDGWDPDDLLEPISEEWQLTLKF